MKLTRSRWIAATSGILLIAASIQGARRPRYGGELRVEIARMMDSRDPDAQAADPAVEALRQGLLSQISETAPGRSGPFRVAKWAPGKAMRLEAVDEYERGRPFLDAVEIRRVSNVNDRLLDLELGKTDVAAVEVTDVRRLQRQGLTVKQTRPEDTLALLFENAQVPANVREALALAIDRTTMQRVLLDRQGEISGALLPEWLSGYAFLFSTERDVTRAKMLARGAAPLKFAYDGADPLVRSVAERIVVNAAEAGLVLRTGSSHCDVRLRRLPLLSSDARQALEEDAQILGMTIPDAATPYEAERSLLKDFRVIPLFHLPLVYAVRANVRNWTDLRHLDDVWLENVSKP